MSETPSSPETRRAVLRCLLLEGQQSTKILVDQSLLGRPEEHGFPSSVLASYPEGVPLDLNPRWPMELDLDSDADAVLVSLSFEGKSHRCRIPLAAIRVIGVGFGGVNWEHERLIDEDDGDLLPGPGSEGRGSHLRIVK